MNIVWYNPDDSIYQTGVIEDFKNVKKSSLNADRFEMVATVPTGKTRIVDKVIMNLNLMRNASLN